MLPVLLPEVADPLRTVVRNDLAIRTAGLPVVPMDALCPVVAPDARLDTDAVADLQGWLARSHGSGHARPRD